MIKFDAWWMPDGETHLPHWMTVSQQKRDGRLTYQIRKYEAALALCKQRRSVIDVGAHVGLWSYWMAKDFTNLFAFEPHHDHQDCWRKNMEGLTNAALFCYALGAQPGHVTLTTGPSSSGDTYVSPNGAKGPKVELRRLDEFTVHDVDLLKIDCEGFEYYVLQGALETIARCKPVIVVEQKPTHGQKYGISDTAGAQLLKTVGYVERKTINGDVILTHREVA